VNCNKFVIALALLCANLPINAVTWDRYIEYREYEPDFAPKTWDYEQAYKDYKMAIENYKKAIESHKQDPGPKSHSELVEAQKKYEEAFWLIRILKILSKETRVELGLQKSSPVLDSWFNPTHSSYLAKIFSNADYLTDEEQRQQGWPIDIGVPRNMTPEEKQQLEKSITEIINYNVQAMVNAVKNTINERNKYGLPSLTLPEIKSIKIIYIRRDIAPMDVRPGFNDRIFNFDNNSDRHSDTIDNRSIKIAYKKILPLLSYWEQYAPNMIKSIGYTLRTIKNYISSWTVEPVTNRFYQALKRQKEKNEMKKIPPSFSGYSINH